MCQPILHLKVNKALWLMHKQQMSLLILPLKVNKEVFAVAEEKLDAVLLAAGITGAAAKPGEGQQGRSFSVGDKQTAANDQTLMRVEQAKKDLEKQKKELRQRENALKKATEKQSKLSQFNARHRSRGFY